ncbi:MAG: ABC transporter substrate-binding protein [Treponema sp.]|nr:ABC transporter substrate-binding protein [Treponema sp.]
MKGKLFLLVILILLTGSFIFASGGTDQQGAAQTGPVTVEFWYIPTSSEAGPPPANWKAFQMVKDKLNVNWVLTMLPSNAGDRVTKTNAAAAANSLPDMLWIDRSNLVPLVPTGTIAQVDDMYPLIPNWTRLYAGTDGRDFTTISGKSYGIPYAGGGQPMNEGMLIRKDWLDKTGQKVPSTTDEYLSVMRAFTNNDPDGNGRADTYGYGAFLDVTSGSEGLGTRMDPLFGAFGVAGTWNLTKADAGLNVRKPAYFNALSYVKQMIDEKIIDPNWISYTRDDFRASWKQGRFGLMRENHSAYASESNYAPFDKNFPNGDWIVLNPPKGPQGQSAVGTYTGSYGIISVSAKAAKEGKSPVIAKIFEWMATDEAYYLLGWGEKGVNYNLDSAGVPLDTGLPDPSKAYTQPEIIPLIQLRGYIQRNTDAELVSRYPTYKAPTSGKTMSALVTLREMQACPWVNVMGVDTLPLPNGDLKRFYEQGVMEFLTGQRQLTQANWTAWVAEFDKLGGLEWEKAGIAEAAANNFLK